MLPATDLEDLCLRRPASAEATLAFLRAAAEPRSVGRVRVTGGVVPHLAPDAAARRVEVDQTNASWIVDDAVVAKWHNPPFVGPHPAGDRLRRLAGAGFEAMPPLVALAEWCTDDGSWVPLVTATAYLPGAEDGWTWCVREARTALGLESGSVSTHPGWAADLGELVALMHLGLAEPGAPDVAVHGDLHVGQLLRQEDGRMYIVDFDGNPTLSAEERMAQRPAAYDIAGMLLSLENVGHVVRHRAADPVPDSDIVAWTEATQHDFLSSYRAALSAGGRPDLLDESLLEPMMTDQIHRELAYATDFLPSWRFVPQAALTRRGML